MKKLKLKKGVKNKMMGGLAIINLFIYSKVGYLGELAQTSKTYLIICLMTWSWLILSNLAILKTIGSDLNGNQ
jgi:hypothetical protein